METAGCVRAYGMATCLWMVWSASLAAGAVAIEHAGLFSDPEAQCTKIRVHLRNGGAQPVTVKEIHLDGRRLDVATGEVAEVDGTPAARDAGNTFDRPDGVVQWHRALPNPIGPATVGEVEISLWGRVQPAQLRVLLADGQALDCAPRDESRGLRLAHVAFDAAAARLYVYVENTSAQPAQVTSVSISAARAVEASSIPDGNRIEPGKKLCIIARPARWPAPGEYVSVAVVAADGRKAFALTRTMNLFTISEWEGDTRPEMFFDAQPLLLKGNAATGPDPDTAAGAARKPFFAYLAMKDPIILTNADGWEFNARETLRRMARIRAGDPARPCFANTFGSAVRYSKRRTDFNSLYGDVPDGMLVHPFRALSAGPGKSAEAFRDTRFWIDPRPAVGQIEVAAGNRFVSPTGRQPSVDEVMHAAWAMTSEGSRGVHHTQRNSGGYATVPHLATVVAHVNVDLQLLKCFMRMGDTMPLASCDVPNVSAGAILCADRGIVVIALNRQTRWKDASLAAQWLPVKSCELAVSVPAGRTVKQALAVDQGLAPAKFSEDKGTIRIPVKDLDVVRVFLLPFGNDPAPVAPQIDPPMTADATGVQGVDLLRNWRQTQAVRAAEALLKSDAALDPREALRIGAELGALRAAVLRRLGELPAALHDATEEDRRRAWRVAAATYLWMNATSELRAACDDPAFPQAERARIVLAAADAAAEQGRCGLAAELYETALQRTPGPKERATALDRLIDLWGQKLWDEDKAAAWRAVKAKTPG